MGCVNVPVGDQLIEYRDSRIVKTEDVACEKRWLALPPGSKQVAVLDPSGFSLMTWNVYKAQGEHWSNEFARLSRDQDIVLLQEAYLTLSFRAALEQSRFQWSMVHAFDYNGAESGVLTASKAPASGACLSRVVEPLIRIPKSWLMTRYPLGRSGEELWVANLHGINFTIGTVRFRAQLESMASVLEAHRGPLILAGDFNNWNERRSGILWTIIERLKLISLTLTEDERSLHWGNPVDHVFYRGLEVVEAGALKVSSSDHNPVRVKFNVPDYSQEEQR